MTKSQTKEMYIERKFFMKRTYIVTVEEIDTKIQTAKTADKISQFVEKHILALVYIAYLLLFSISIIIPSNMTSLAISVFSFGIAFCYFSPITNKLPTWGIAKNIKGKNIAIFVNVLIFSALSLITMWVISVFPVDIPFVGYNNIGNILTWWSIVFFAIDKIKESKD